MVLIPHRADGAAEVSTARRLSTWVAGDAQQMVVPPDDKITTATAQKARPVGLRGVQGIFCISILDGPKINNLLSAQVKKSRSSQKTF